MNTANLSIETDTPEMVKKAVNNSLEGNDRVDVEVKADENLKVNITAKDKTSFRGILNSVLRLTKLADKVIN